MCIADIALDAHFCTYVFNGLGEVCSECGKDRHGWDANGSEVLLDIPDFILSPQAKLDL